MYDFFKKLAVTYLSLHVMVMERDVCFLLHHRQDHGPLKTVTTHKQMQTLTQKLVVDDTDTLEGMKQTT